MFTFIFFRIWIIPWNIPRNIPWNIKIKKMEYSKKYSQHVKTQLFWNMEYSGIFQKLTSTRIFHDFFGIWNIHFYWIQGFFAFDGTCSIPIFTLNKI